MPLDSFSSNRWCSRRSFRVAAIVLGAGVLFGALPLQAIELSVTSAAAPVMEPVQASARRVDGGVTVPIRLSADAPTRVELPPGLWELAIDSPRFWSAPVYLPASAAEATVKLWPRATVTGHVSPRSPASATLVVRFAARNAKGEVAEPSGTIDCAFRDRAWSCALPASELDLQFGLTGYATEFRWGVKVPAGSVTDAGTLDFAPGSALSGTVEVQKHVRADLTAAEVSLSPANVEGGAALRELTAKPNSRGFFQVRGLAPGQYVVRARAKGLVTQPRPVEIIAGTNAALKAPLILAAPVTLSVSITPPVSPAGQRWQVQLATGIPGSDRGDVLDRSLASPQGTWRARALTPGEYFLQIEQQDGSVWRWERVVVGDEDLQLDLLATAEKVSGAVFLGDRPLQAAVQFGDDHGQTLHADEKGEFSGVIPLLTAGDEVPILVSAETPDVRRTVRMKGTVKADGGLRFDIHLPATTIVGQTVNTDGSPEPFAGLTVRSDSDQVVQQLTSHEDGSFQIYGFEPGTYRLQADNFRKRSSVVTVEAAETSDPVPVQVVLTSDEEVRGEIAMGAARVAGASVYALPVNTTTAYVPHATSDAAGRFVILLPPGTETYDMVVVPRGFSVTCARIRREPGKIVHVEVTQAPGTLTADIPEGGIPLLVHDGAELSLPWMAIRSGGTTEPSDKRQRLTVANLEAGTYAVCTGGKCVSVYVPPFSSAHAAIQ